MADPETRKEIARAVKEACPVVSLLASDLLSSGKCPYFGASGTCYDCTRTWMVTAENVLKLAKQRRAAYEKEREKNKFLVVQIDAVRVFARNVNAAVGRYEESKNGEFENDDG